ncbi:hypothetical protein B0T21DRAFT_358236 [Apiosordaria backusii]|uniref:Cytochrome c oxidase subunit 9, mitochondrial n=1 Tax=Apiosordaria backusii TaxID=314023 RepID=A0AA40K3M8_9PEZI|nr:hypothetical protein B0T21DRAFT_358236 [Apiosordaria backusii]
MAAAAPAFKPITGMLRRGLILDLSIGLGMPRFPHPVPPHLPLEMDTNRCWLVVAGLGFVFGNAFWYGYHMPRVNARDNYYRKLEEARAARQG